MDELPSADQIARWLGAPAGAEADWSVACDAVSCTVDWRAWCAEWLPAFTLWIVASVTSALAILNAVGTAPTPTALVALLAALLALVVGGLAAVSQGSTGDWAFRRFARGRPGPRRLTAWGHGLRLESSAGGLDLVWTDITACDGRRRLVSLSRGRRLRLPPGGGADTILNAIHQIRLHELRGRAVATAERRRLDRLPTGALSRLTGDREADERALSRVEPGDG